MLCDSTYCLQANTCAKRVSKKREWQRGLFGPKNARANGETEGKDWAAAGVPWGGRWAGAKNEYKADRGRGNSRALGRTSR